MPTLERAARWLGTVAFSFAVTLALLTVALGDELRVGNATGQTVRVRRLVVGCTDGVRDYRYRRPRPIAPGATVRWQVDGRIRRRPGPPARAAVWIVGDAGRDWGPCWCTERDGVVRVKLIEGP